MSQSGFFSNFFYSPPNQSQTPAIAADDSTQTQNQTGGYYPSQPAQRTPFRAYQPPRVDNANQPWYGANNRRGMMSPDTIQNYDAVTQDESGNSIPQLKSVWDVLNSWFGGQAQTTAKMNLQSTQNVYSPNQEVVDPASLGGSQRGPSMSDDSYDPLDSTPSYGGYGSPSTQDDGNASGSLDGYRPPIDIQGYGWSMRGRRGASMNQFAGQAPGLSMSARLNTAGNVIDSQGADITGYGSNVKIDTTAYDNANKPPPKVTWWTPKKG